MSRSNWAAPMSQTQQRLLLGPSSTGLRVTAPHALRPELRSLNTTKSMRASTLEAGNMGMSLKSHPMPSIIHETDVIVQIEKTTICGTDLHLTSNKVDTTHEGVVLGHEGVGTIIKCGKAVSKYKEGDRVLVPCITKCGKCKNCLASFHGHCTLGGGWILGHMVDGLQCEYARVPYGDESLYLLPEGCTPEQEEEILMCADILPTAYEIGLLDGHMTKDKTVVIVGTGPIGLASLLLVNSLFKDSAPNSEQKIIAVDQLDSRLGTARNFGATHTVNAATREDTKAAILQLTDGKGADLVLECVGNPGAWYTCQDIVSAGGHISLLGVHGESATLNLETMWKRNFTLSAGMVHCHSIPSLMDSVMDGSLPAKKVITDHMPLSELEWAYNHFRGRTRKDSAEPIFKILVENDISPRL